ncbi:MAG: hypothetical protein WCS84_00525 [Nocardioides sp.]
MSLRAASRRTSGTLLALGLGLALTACSGGTTAASGPRSSAEPSITPSSTATSAAATGTPSVSPLVPEPSEPPSESSSGPDPVCGGLELSRVREVLGPRMRSYLAEVDYCVYAGPRSQHPTLIVTAAPTLGDPAEFALEARDFCDSDVTDVPGVGDAAFVCNSPVGPQGLVVAGDAWVQLDLTSGDTPADLASLLELLPSVVVPTGLEFPE